MAYDEGLAERIRDVLVDERGITEKKMFGGIAFLLDGKMFVGIVKDDLMVRVGPDHYAASLKRAHVRPMDFTGKPMAGYVYVAPAGLTDDEELERWVRLAAKFAATLKASAPSRRAPRAGGTPRAKRR
jgi:TfoX/Sxy family transcriptional regulator of competence genes